MVGLEATSRTARYPKIDGTRDVAVEAIREMLRGTTSAQRLRSDRSSVARRWSGLACMEKMNQLRRFPINSTTRKGNLAEVVLAEVRGRGIRRESAEVYRLRYNPNVDQSMKGDDVLAFDLDAKPVRIIVGEARFGAVLDGTGRQGNR